MKRFGNGKYASTSVTLLKIVILLVVITAIRYMSEKKNKCGGGPIVGHYKPLNIPCR